MNARAVLAGVLLLALSAAASAETATFALSDAAVLTASCPSPRVLRKGPDLLIRCADRPDPWLTIRNFAVNCPTPRATADRAGNLTLRCT